MKNLTDDMHTFSVDEWAAAMSVAAGEIDKTGRSMVATHRQASERAEEVCRDWRLQQRQAEERVALENLFASAREILEKLNHALGSDDPVRLAVAADAIEGPLVERADEASVVDPSTHAEVGTEMRAERVRHAIGAAVMPGDQLPSDGLQRQHLARAARFGHHCPLSGPAGSSARSGPNL